MKKKKFKNKRLKVAFWVFVAAAGAWVAFAPHTRLSTPTSVTIKVEQPSIRVEQLPPKAEEQALQPPEQGQQPFPPQEPAPQGTVTVPVAPEPEAQTAGKTLKIAIVIDDLGPDYRLSEKAIRLPAAVTLSFLPYAMRVRDLAKEARDKGHEVLLHMPMQPIGNENPGKGALMTDLPLSEIQLRFQTALASFTGFDGVNNHMGSKFTAFAEGMNVVADEMLPRHLFFLDSRTNVNSVAARVAKEKGLSFISRDVFIDDDKSPDAIRKQLELAKRIARRRGHAVAIGHPHNTTLQVLEKWTAEAEGEGVELVPVKSLVEGK